MRSTSGWRGASQETGGAGGAKELPPRSGAQNNSIVCRMAAGVGLETRSAEHQSVPDSATEHAATGRPYSAPDASAEQDSPAFCFAGQPRLSTQTVNTEGSTGVSSGGPHNATSGDISPSRPRPAGYRPLCHASGLVIIVPTDNAFLLARATSAVGVAGEDRRQKLYNDVSLCDP